ncbi:D-serine deaminase-like pyridoxal phosphate-dependent protein [Paenibacillus sp. BK033]|uniref:alanine racemase n=1 Tax=Paenibacillus sp. BK033 TaxID=2512133 RepID=UPI00104C34BB|nr:alanine racemase [Paenibacillus sp. BK033]TCM98728.1 D-serine deaminase-like pyridoxal phosphate-dependent protein [Paenibacillus sp. BK033]
MKEAIIISRPLDLSELDTPAVLIDLDILERNIKWTAELARRAGVKLRPHFKTHKSIWIARKQLEYGACGLTVAKLGEAEVLADSGVEDLLIAFPLVGEAKLGRLRALIDRGIKVTISTDHAAVAADISRLGESLNYRIPLYVDVNTGLNRCGGEPGEETAALIRQMAGMPGVEVRGLMTHGGHAYGKKSLSELREAAAEEVGGLVQTKELLERSGIRIPEISVGSTPTSKFIAEQTGATETRPGAYVFGDISQLAIGSITMDELAMTILATVVSTPRPGTAIIDAGSKTFSSDTNPHRPGYGFLRSDPSVYIERLSEEHGIVKVPEGVQLSIGDRLEFIPNHCCTVTNLHDALHGVRHRKVERLITVDARGRIQ